MRVCSCFTILVLFFFMANGQAPNTGGLGSVANILDPSLKLTSQTGTPVWKGDGSYIVTGSVFYHEEMHKGYVLLSNGKSASDVLLRYNLYTHHVNYMENNTEMVLDAAAPVQEFGYSYTKDDVQKKVVFRAGYPFIEKNNTKTFYEVIVDGNISLLKYTAKRMLSERTVQGEPEKVIVDADWWYIYNASDKKIVEIKKNKSSLLEALPQYASRIKEIIDTKKLRLKSDEDWNVLLEQLSSPKAF